MRLSRNKVRAIIALVVCALAGLVYLQYRLLVNSVELKEQTFKRNVIAAMNFAIEKLEEIDARNIFFVARDTTHASRAARYPLDSSFSYSFVSTQSPGVATQMNNGKLRVTIDKPQRIAIRAFGMLGGLDTTLVDSIRTKGIHDIPLPKDRFSRGVYYVQLKTDSSTMTTRVEPGKQSVSVTVNDEDMRKGKVVKRIVDSFTDAKFVPACKRYSKELVDSILSFSLTAHDVPLPYEFGISTDDSITLARTTLPYSQLAKSEYRVPVIPLEPNPENESLYLHFPGYRSYLMGALLPELGSSIVLLGVIIFCFVYTIRTILRQKEFSGRLVDFINNMTHEFKTPISTIALASDAMTQPDVRSSRTKISRYTKVIKDENRRMRNQVDKILQMATLEEGETEFDTSPIDMHEIIDRAVANIELQVTARNGSVTKQLSAGHAVIRADAVHIENVIHNVLDNALKYSDKEPAITVATSNIGNSLVVTVTDRGIGIPNDHIEKVFGKYYRVPTGNIHDVKGFGLGLSYVKLIVEAHKGTVKLASEPGKGTTIELCFPVDSPH
jgi:two-component system phosphate regulon sensor histidine kinase PhoR